MAQALGDSPTPKPESTDHHDHDHDHDHDHYHHRRSSSLDIRPDPHIANTPPPRLNSWSQVKSAAASSFTSFTSFTSVGPASPSKSSDPFHPDFSRRRSIGAGTQLTSPDGPATRTTLLERPFGKESRSARTSPTLGSPTYRRSHHHHHHHHSSPTSRRSSKNRSPPPILRQDSIPTLPRLTFDPVSASTIESAGPPTPKSPTGGNNYFATTSGNADKFSLKESAPGFGAALSPKRALRLAPAAAGGTASRGDRVDANREVDMSSRRRSMSSSNAHQPHEPFRSNVHDAGAGSRTSDENGTDAPRGKDRREQDKKTMLSKALQKAHTAVLLDNAHNIEGAIEAYEDACGLLGQVLIRSAGEDDRRKLDAIRTTYTNRIQELHQLNRENFTQAAMQTNARNLAPLPARPMSDESLTTPQDTSHRSLEPEPRSEHIGNGQYISLTRSSTNTVASQSAMSDSSMASQPRMSELSHHSRGPSNNSLPLRESPLEQPPATFRSTERFLTVGSPMDASYAPPPLSPRRLQPESIGEPPKQSLPVPPKDATMKGHARGDSGNSISWLDTIDESGGSSDGSSVHSLRKGKIRRKHVRLPSGDTEAEFDAALDAAVEAAYADGMEPFDYDEESLDYRPEVQLPAPVKAMVDTERKRLSDRSQIIQQAHARTKQISKDASRRSRDPYRVSDEEDEEERILAEISKDFGFDFGLSSKSNSQPRQSDSSEYSGGSTYHSSMSSSKTTAMTHLSTVSESETREAMSRTNQNLPRLSEEDNQRDSLPLGAGRRLSQSNTGSVRSRRMSGQNARQLKIETQIPARTKIPPPAVTAPPASMMESRPFSAISDTQLLPDTVFKPTVPIVAPLTIPIQPPPQTFVTESSPIFVDSSTSHAPIPPSPSTPAPPVPIGENGSPRPDIKPANDRPNALKKNKSSVSLKNRTLSISSPDGSEVSIGTPLSTSFSGMSTGGSKKNMAYTDAGAPPTPSLPNFGSALLHTTSNVNIFESDLHSPYVPGSPNPTAPNAPIPLEPCPDSHLLRPYWLMRCFYQTIAHPRGGYLSTKLFVPRDVWRVKGVKIKGVDDKIANCDYLTSALQKLNNVDTFDADAVMEEMQQFELVLDQVQSNLSKKLGNEVSVQGIQALFKDAPVSSGDSPMEPTSATSASGRAVSQGKSFVSSWRKLRSKSSAVNLTSSTYSGSSGKSAGGGGSGPDGSRDALTMSTLPMTSLPNQRFAKREVARLEVSGPHKEYMESLAKLFDAVQIIDQIARQVEDPGLKHTSPTHVGLELSTRHASEFFGFYICRFVLTDLTMLLDKFIKRGSEWVLV